MIILSFILIINLITLFLISLMVWWRWRERSLNKRLEEVILTVPTVEEVPLKMVDIKGEIITGSMVEEELDENEDTVEMREWRNEQNWLNRRKQAET